VIPLQPKKSWPRRRLIPTSVQLQLFLLGPLHALCWRIYISLVCSIYTIYSFFFFSVLWLCSICYHAYLLFIFRRSRLLFFHLYIYNHVTVHHTYIHVFFLGQPVRTRYTRTLNRSRLNAPSSLPSLARTCITYIIPMHRSIIHAFLDNFILQYSYMLS